MEEYYCHLESLLQPASSGWADARQIMLSSAEDFVHHGSSSSSGFSAVYSSDFPSRCQDNVVESPSASTMQEQFYEFLRNHEERKESTIPASSGPWNAFPQRHSVISPVGFSAPPSRHYPAPNALAHGATKFSAPPTGRCHSPSTRSTILARRHSDWYFTIYIRIDRSGTFHTYPHLGGPFKSLQDTENAIDRHLWGLCHETMRKESLDKLSLKDRFIRQSRYWPDGRSKAYSKEFVSENTHKGMCHLVQALVDKCNEDYYLLGDLAYELKDVLHYQTICERHIWYYHFNFTAKTKGAAIDDLFFAEVTCMKGHELAVSSFCRIDINANGHCYGCMNNGGLDMKHPNEVDAYTAGSLDGYLPFGYDVQCDFQVKAEEDRLSSIYEGFDDPDFLKEIFTPSPHATATFIED